MAVYAGKYKDGKVFKDSEPTYYYLAGHSVVSVTDAFISSIEAAAVSHFNYSLPLSMPHGYLYALSKLTMCICNDNYCRHLDS